jgi:hypothetical protein
MISKCIIPAPDGDVNGIAFLSVLGNAGQVRQGTLVRGWNGGMGIMMLRRVLFLIVLMLMGLNLAACSGSLFRNYGKISPSEEADRDIEAGVVRPEIRYYTSGSDLYPNALIGLHRDYRLDRETLWKEVAMTPEKLREIVGFMKAKAREFHLYPYGFDLLDPGGKKIGFWYSILTARTFLHFEEDGTVMILTPELQTFDKLEYKESPD